MSSVRCLYAQTLWQQSCTAFIGLSNDAIIVGGVRPHLPEILIENDPLPSETPISNRYSLVCASAVTPSEKVHLTQIHK